MCAEFEPTDAPDNSEIASSKVEKRLLPREIISPITGCRVVARRPGQRMVTSEEIRKELEEFP